MFKKVQKSAFNQIRAIFKTAQASIAIKAKQLADSSGFVAVIEIKSPFWPTSADCTSPFLFNYHFLVLLWRNAVTASYKLNVQSLFVFLILSASGLFIGGAFTVFTLSSSIAFFAKRIFIGVREFVKVSNRLSDFTSGTALFDYSNVSQGVNLHSRFANWSGSFGCVNTLRAASILARQIVV